MIKDFTISTCTWIGVQVMDRNEGMHGLQLPWEDACMTAVNRRKLGSFAAV